MARSIYTGTLGWGLVQVPITLQSAHSPQSIKFNQINSKTGARVKQKRVDGDTGAAVAYEDIVKGFETAPGQFVTITSEELDAVAPAKTKRIDIERFVNLAEIDPVFYDKSYYVAPQQGAEKVYRLLADVMLADGRAALGKVVIRSKQQLCVVRPNPARVLVCSTALWADEVNDFMAIAAKVNNPANEASDAERAQASMLIDALAGSFDPSEFKDEYRERVQALIDAKAAGQDPPAETEGEEPPVAPDLLAALTASVSAAKAEKPSQPEPVEAEKAAA